MFVVDLLKLAVLGALTFGTCAGFAQDAASTASLNESAPQRSRFRISYFADVDGPSVSNPESPFKNDEDGNPDLRARVGWFHEPGIGYRLNNGLTVNMKAAFTHFSRPNEKGESFEMDDLAFGIANSGLIRTENFNLYAGLNTSPAMTEYSRSRQRTGTVGSTLIPSYKFSNFELVWVSLLKQYFYQPGEELNSKTKSSIAKGTLSNFKIEFYPALLYSFTDKFAALIGGHLLFINSRGQGTEFTQLEDSFHIGLNYKFSRALTLRPEIRFQVPHAITARNTEAGMLIFGSL